MSIQLDSVSHSDTPGSKSGQNPVEAKQDLGPFA